LVHILLNDVPPKHGELSDFEKLLFDDNSVYDHRFKGVFHLFPNKLHNYMQISSGNILPRISKESAYGNSKVFVFPRNHRFFESFNKQIEQVIAAGIIDHFGDDAKDLVKAKRFITSKLESAKPMSMSHLKAGFVVWLVSLIFPFAAFIGEWVLRIRDLIVFKSVRKAFFKLHEINSRNHDIEMQKTILKMKKESAQSKNTKSHKRIMPKVLREKMITKYQKNIDLKQNNPNQQSIEVPENTIESMYDDLLNDEIHHQPNSQYQVDDERAIENRRTNHAEIQRKNIGQPQNTIDSIESIESIESIYEEIMSIDFEN
jgi:hypothetical protein